MGQVYAIEIKGAKELRRAINKASDKASKDRLKEANKASSEVVAREARVLVPKLTGTLSTTIRAGGGVTKGLVRTGTARVPYAGPIHFGWRKRNIRPQPFLYDALDRRSEEVIETYERLVSDIVKTVTDG